MSFVLKMMTFVLKTMKFALKDLGKKYKWAGVDDTVCVDPAFFEAILGE